MRSIVVVEKAALDKESMTEQFKKSIKTLFLDDAFAKSKAVFIKPNLTYPSYKEGVTTRVGSWKVLLRLSGPLIPQLKFISVKERGVIIVFQ